MFSGFMFDRIRLQHQIFVAPNPIPSAALEVIWSDIVLQYRRKRTLQSQPSHSKLPGTSGFYQINSSKVTVLPNKNITTVYKTRNLRTQKTHLKKNQRSRRWTGLWRLREHRLSLACEEIHMYREHKRWEKNQQKRDYKENWSLKGGSVLWQRRS